MFHTPEEISSASQVCSDLAGEEVLTLAISEERKSKTTEAELKIFLHQDTKIWTVSDIRVSLVLKRRVRRATSGGQQR